MTDLNQNTRISSDAAMYRSTRFAFAMVMIVALIVAFHGDAYSQEAAQPTNDAPNPYRTIENFFKLPEGRTWGSTSAVAIDKDGKSVWIAERCGKNSCVEDATTGKMSDVATIMRFDASGKLVKSFGAGMLTFPHGIFVDNDGNIWVTD